VLVLRPGALGDTLLAVPALRALRRAFAPLTLAAHSPAARLLEQVHEVDHGIAFDDPALAWLFRDDAPLAEIIVAWMRPEAAPALRAAALVAPSRPPAMDRHVARYLFESLAPLGIDLTWDDTPLHVEPLVSDEVLIHPGSGSSMKNWPAARYAEVIRRLGEPVRLVIGEADFGVAAAVEAEVGCDLPRLELPPLDELAARLAGCRAYLGNDSGVSHLAGLCGARSVVLFGPTDQAVWRPLGHAVQTASFGAKPQEVANLLLAS
jgi:ADP-heptose:LPS heptosyltransferase